jgi:DNA-binding transcriptional LysR family regulator
MESLLRPNKPFDPSDTSRDFAVAASEAGELILLQPLRQRLRPQAPSVKVDWMPSYREENIDALRNGRCHFVIDIKGALMQAPDIRVLKLFDDTLVTLARQKHKLAKRKAKPDMFAAADHIEVSSLPAIELLNRELGVAKLSCNVSSRVSSVLVGLLLALNSDALLTLPASLASILETQFGLLRIQQPFGSVAFPLRVMWHSSYDRDECHEWVRGEFANLAREMGSVG